MMTISKFFLALLLMTTTIPKSMCSMSNSSTTATTTTTFDNNDNGSLSYLRKAIDVDVNTDDNTTVVSDSITDDTHNLLESISTLRSLAAVPFPGVNLSYNLLSSRRYGGTGLKCSNKYGSNPCGPDGLCRDTKTGYSCRPLLRQFDDCGASGGCGPNSYCTTITSTRKMCLCFTGFRRNAAHLPCVRIK